MKLTTLLSCVVLTFATFSMSTFAADSYQHLRSATGKLRIANKIFLIDPMLANKGAYPGFEGTHNSQLRNPLTELPLTVEKIYHDVDGVIVTHTHLDHWDTAAQDKLPKTMLIITQHEQDAQLIRAQGFNNVQILKDTLQVDNVTLVKTHGAHGTAEMYATPLGEMLGEAMGVVFKAEGHPTTYLVGDTVWTADVNKAILKHQPQVLIVNTGDARTLAFPDDGIIMSKQDVRRAYSMLPEAKIITVHMDAVNHMTVTSDDMRAYVTENKLSDRVLVPQQGDIIKF
ncbi:MAG: MBL fold metallo-hydrolase [Vibrio sp.]